MTDVSIRNQVSDEKTSANTGMLQIGNVATALPNKFATTAELNATRVVGTKDALPGEVIVSAKLMYPESLKKILKQNTALRDFARRISRESGGSRMSREYCFSSSREMLRAMMQMISGRSWIYSTSLTWTL